MEDPVNRNHNSPISDSSASGESGSTDSEITSPVFEPLSPTASSGIGSSSSDTATNGPESTSSALDTNLTTAAAAGAAAIPQTSPENMESSGSSSKVRAKVLTEKRKNIIFDFRGGAEGCPTGNGSIGSEVWKLKLFEFFQRKGNDSTVSMYDIHRWIHTHPWITIQTSELAFSTGAKARVPKTNKRQVVATSEGEPSTRTKARQPKTKKRKSNDSAVGNEYETPHLPAKAKNSAKRRKLAIEPVEDVGPESLSARIRVNQENAATKQAAAKIDPIRAPSKRIITRRKRLIDEPVPVPAKVPVLTSVTHKPLPDVTPLSPSMPVLLARNLRKLSICSSPDSASPKKMPKLKRLSAIPRLTSNPEDSKSGSTVGSAVSQFTDPGEGILVVIKDFTKEMDEIADRLNDSFVDEPSKPDPVPEPSKPDLTPDPIGGRPSAECDNLKTLASCIKSVNSFSTDFEVNKEGGEAAFAEIMDWVTESFHPEPNLPAPRRSANIEKNSNSATAELQEIPSNKPTSSPSTCIATSISVIGKDIPPNLKYVSTGIQPFAEIPASTAVEADVDVETLDLTNDSELKTCNHPQLVRPWENDFANMTANIPNLVPIPNSPKSKMARSSDGDFGTFSNGHCSPVVVFGPSGYPQSFVWDSNATSTNSNSNNVFPLSISLSSESGSGGPTDRYGAPTNSFGLYSPPAAGEFAPLFASMLQQNNNRGMNYFNGNSSPRRVKHYQDEAQTQVRSTALPQSGLKHYRTILPRQTVLDLPSYFNASASASTSPTATVVTQQTQQTSPIPVRTNSSQTEIKPNLSKMLSLLDQLNFTLSTTPELYGCIGSLKHIVRELEKYRRTQIRRTQNDEAGFNGNGGHESTQDEIPLVNIDE